MLLFSVCQLTSAMLMSNILASAGGRFKGGGTLWEQVERMGW